MTLLLILAAVLMAALASWGVRAACRDEPVDLEEMRRWERAREATRGGLWL